MNYYPNTDKYPYPEDTSMHYLKIKKDNGSINIQIIVNHLGLKYSL